MSESKDGKTTPHDADIEQTDPPGSDEEANHGEGDEGNITHLSRSLLASLDSLDNLVDNANASIPEENTDSQIAQQNIDTQEDYPNEDDQLYMILSQLRQDINDIRQEQTHQNVPPAERQLYDMFAELRRDIETIKHEQGTPNIAGASGSERELYSALSELRRDIGVLKNDQDYAVPAGIGPRRFTWASMGKLTVIGFAAGLAVVLLELGVDWLRTEFDNVSAQSQRSKIGRSAPVTAPTRIARDVFGFAGTPISLDIDLSRLPITEGSIVRITRMSRGVVLSTGQKKGNDWLIPARDLIGIKMIAPADFTGYVNARVEVFNGEGKIIQSGSFRATILPNAAQPAAKPVEPAPKPTLSQKPLQAPVPKLASAEEKELITNANSLLEQGDIVAARRVLDFAVSQGSVSAALALAKTYDPKTVNQLPNLFGVRTDITRAKVLYYFAARKGNKEAAKRLSEITGGR